MAGVMHAKNHPSFGHSQYIDIYRGIPNVSPITGPIFCILKMGLFSRHKYDDVFASGGYTNNHQPNIQRKNQVGN